MAAHHPPQDSDEPDLDANDVSGPQMPAESGQEGAGPRQGGTAASKGAIAGLSARQGQAVEALLHEGTVSRAAAVVGVNERTLRRWLDMPHFRAAWITARRDAFGQAIGLTQRYAPVAVATLVKVMNDVGSAASAKVTAAGVLLKFGREGIELDDLAERVANLERAAKGGAPPEEQRS